MALSWASPDCRPRWQLGKMQDDSGDLLFYQACRSLDGRVCIPLVGKRNGRRTAFFGPDWAHPGTQNASSRFHPEDLGIEDLFLNLTEIERSTWERILDSRSIPSIADEDRISTSAVYERIRGSSKRHGGMVAKNRWVARWWAARLESKNNL